MFPASRFSLVCQLLLVLACPVQAEDKPSLMVELNAVTAQDQACRLTFVVESKLGADLNALVYETVLFNKDGQVMTMTLFDFGAVPNGRPRVRQFDLPETDCASIGRVLLNDTHTCQGDGLAEGICIEALKWSSRTEIEVLG